MDEESFDGGTALLRLIEKATTSVDRQIDPHLLKSIKSIVRSSDGSVRVAVGALMDKMKKEHSLVRYHALLIIDELFMRSKLFRTLLVVNFDHLLSLSIGFRRNAPLPPPSAIASLLQTKSIEFLEKWNDSFGIHYRQIRLGFNYLKNTLKFQFPNRLENDSRLEHERREREARSKEILLNKFENLKENFSTFKLEIYSTLDEIGECLDIIHTRGNEYNEESLVDNDESVEFNSSALWKIRLDSLKEGTKIQENSENKAVFDALRELYKLTVSKHVRSIQESMSVLVRVDLIDNTFRESALKELIDLRNHVRTTLKRCDEAGCNLSSANTDEEDLWEEGKIEMCKTMSSPTANHPSAASAEVVISGKNKGKAPLDSGRSPERSAKEDDQDSSVRSKLLAEAPIFKWSGFMDTWGSNYDVLANQRGLELDNHWGRVDQHAVIPVNRIAELTYHVTTYKEAPVESRPCHAPLKKGGLCQRRDLRVCPFHGPIIPRDDKGNPLEEKRVDNKPVKCKNAEEIRGQISASMPDDVASVSGDNLVKELVKQAVKNVRQLDRDTKALKKAKIAKVRQHNEAVLREAAIASSSFATNFGEDSAQGYQNQPGNKVKKPTLASMLRKKETVKDRLSQKLLNTHVTESTVRQLKQGEEARYREAFPNQW